MKNKEDVRGEFLSMAVNVYGVDFAMSLLDQYDDIMEDKVEVFEVDGLPEMFYQVYKTEEGQWSWTFFEPGEDDEEASRSFPSRREAMLDAARDSDDTILVDGYLGSRIRAAI